MLDALTYWHKNIVTKSRQKADSAERMEGHLSESRKVGAASFWITKQAIKVLLDHQATAPQICAYLVLARHTDKSGVFSTAGMQAVYTKIGIGQAVAKRAVDALCEMRLGGTDAQPLFLVHKAMDDMGLVHGPGERSKIRYVLPDLDAPNDERVWLGANLVDGFKAFRIPLKRLKAMGDIPARLLLYLWQFEAMEEFGGILPWSSIYQQAEMTKLGWGEGFWGVDIWKATLGNFTTNWECIYSVTGSEKKKKAQESSAKYDERLGAARDMFWEARAKLEAAGFIYRMISVMDRKEGDPDGQILFELGIKSTNDYQPPKGEEGLGKQTAELVERIIGTNVADSMGRIRDEYAVVVPGGFSAYVVGIYRMRFRVSNPNNMGIKGAWARIHRGNAEALEWLQDLAERVNKSRGGKNPVSFPWMKNTKMDDPDDGFGDFEDHHQGRDDDEESPPF